MKTHLLITVLATLMLAFVLQPCAQGASKPAAKATKPAPGTTTSDAQAEAIRRYPELGKAGSAFNVEFVSRVKRYQKEKPDFFKDTAWPVKLADEVAKAGEKPAPGNVNAAPAPPTDVKPVKEMKWIEPGSFVMGSPQTEKGRKENEGPETNVTLTKGFWMGEHEVTQAEYQAVIGSNPVPPLTKQVDPTAPVMVVDWENAVAYCEKLTATEKAAGRLPQRGWAYRLPTEAEWEYCCRAGSKTRYSFGDDDSKLGDYAWHWRNSDVKTSPVGQKQANAWGLKDMHGNVSELCQKLYGKYPGGTVVDPVPTGDGGVIRGGSWSIDQVDDFRSAWRGGGGGRSTSIGFRVVLAPTQP